AEQRPRKARDERGVSESYEENFLREVGKGHAARIQKYPIQELMDSLVTGASHLLHLVEPDGSPAQNRKDNCRIGDQRQPIADAVAGSFVNVPTIINLWSWKK